MLPLRSVPPCGAPPEMEIVNESVVPGSPLSVTFTVKVHTTPLLVQVPPNVAVLPDIVNAVNDELQVAGDGTGGGLALHNKPKVGNAARDVDGADASHLPHAD